MPREGSYGDSIGGEQIFQNQESSSESTNASNSEMQGAGREVAFQDFEGYGGFPKDFSNSVESTMEIEKEKEAQDSKVKILDKLIADQFDAMLSGNSEAIKKSAAVLQMFKDRNNIA